MVRLEEMDVKELRGVIAMKDLQIKDLKEELAAYQQLVDELQQKLGITDHSYTGNGD